MIQFSGCLYLLNISTETPVTAKALCAVCNIDPAAVCPELSYCHLVCAQFVQDLKRWVTDTQ